jgi:hypothetical protein
VCRVSADAIDKVSGHEATRMKFKFRLPSPRHTDLYNFLSRDEEKKNYYFLLLFKVHPLLLAFDCFDVFYVHRKFIAIL